MTLQPYNEKTIARFWSKVDTNGTVPTHCPEIGACWVWVAGCSSSGYGTFWIKPTAPISAHRLAYELHFGLVGLALDVCHKCDNRKCCNPAHLFKGTRKQNMEDASAKGRLNGRNCPRGSLVNTAKLTPEAVTQIRIKYANGEANQSELARTYGVSHSSIQAIIARRNWKHIRAVRERLTAAVPPQSA